MATRGAILVSVGVTFMSWRAAVRFMSGYQPCCGVCSGFGLRVQAAFVFSLFCGAWLLVVKWGRSS